MDHIADNYSGNPSVTVREGGSIIMDTAGSVAPEFLPYYI